MDSNRKESSFAGHHLVVGLLCVAAWVLTLVPASESFASPLVFSYSGRLTEETGKPVKGPVSLRVAFYRTATGGTPVLTVTEGLAAVPLQEGIFQISLSIAGSDFHDAFPSVSTAAYVEITDLTNRPDDPYERQVVTLVPYAGKVPVDNRTIVFDDSGQASLKVSGSQGSGKLLSSDGSGGLVWVDAPAVSVTQVGGVSAANVASGANAANQASSTAVNNAIVKRDGSGGFAVTSVAAGLINLTPTAPSASPLIVNAASGQTANLQEWLSSTGNLLAGIGPDGSLKLGSGSFALSLEAPAGMTASAKYTLPASPSAGQFLTTDAAGILSWVTPPGADDFINASQRAGSAPLTLTTLSAPLNPADVTASVVSTSGYPESGTLLIGSEIIRYAGKTPTNFTGLTRGMYGTTDSLHATNVLVGTYLFIAGRDAAAAPALVVSGAGYVGIGVSDPDARLEISGQIKITGGAPGAGKVLTSDANGLASWVNPGTPGAHASSHQHGGLDEIGSAVSSANAIPKAGADGKLDIGWLPAATPSAAGTMSGADKTSLDSLVSSSSSWNTAYDDRLKWDGSAVGNFVAQANARTNLGLGTAATAAIGTGPTDVAAGNHSHADATTGASGFMSAGDKTKLDGIAAGADVTNSASVDAAGAVMNSDFSSNGLMVRTGAGSYSSVTNNSANWDSAFTDRLKWDGGATGLNAATGRTSLGLGGMATQEANAVAITGGTITGVSVTHADNSISGDKVDGGTISNFASTGIDDNASATAMTISSAGLVGIGSNGPAARLDVFQTSTTAADGIRISNPNGSHNVSLWSDASNVARLNSYANGAGDLALNSGGGLVGIGTATPAYLLDIVGGTASQRLSSSAGSQAYTMYSVGGSAVAFIGVANNSGIMNGITNGDFVIAGQSGKLHLGFSSPVLTVSSGNVGIGTTAPDSKLHVTGGGTTTYYGGFERPYFLVTGPGFAHTDRGHLGVYSTDAAAVGNGGVIAIGGKYFNDEIRTYGTISAANEQGLANTSGYLSLSTMGSVGYPAERMRITSVGDVGIGTDTPDGKLHVEGGQIVGSLVTSTSDLIDWSTGNIQKTSAAAGTISFEDDSMVDGATYTLILTNATGGTYTLSSPDVVTWRCQPECPSGQVTVDATKHTVLTLMKAGTDAYVSWIKGF